jgi:hypothetical protein
MQERDVFDRAGKVAQAQKPAATHRITLLHKIVGRHGWQMFSTPMSATIDQFQITVAR